MAWLVHTKGSIILVHTEDIYLFYFFQEDEDGHLVVLGIIQDLMVKAPDIFLDHFARLGIFSKVQALAGPPESQENNEENEQTSDQGEIW